MKNSELNNGVTILTLKTKEIRDLVGETFFKSLMVTLLRAASIVFFTCFKVTIATPSKILTAILDPLIRTVATQTGLQTSTIPTRITSKAATAGGTEARYISKFNKLFKLKWSGGGLGKEIGIALTNNITAATLQMKLYPKFKIK